MRAAHQQIDAGPIVNLARHPRGTALLNTGQFPKWQADRWGGDGTYTLYTAQANHPDGITTGVRFTVTSATLRSSHGLHISGNPEANPPSVNLAQMMRVTPGERITFSLWLRYVGTSTQAYRIKVRPVNSDASAYLSVHSESPMFPLPSGAWTQLYFSYTVPAGCAYLAVLTANANGANSAVGDQIDGTGLMVTRTPALQGANIASDPYATLSTIPNNRWGWVPQWFGGGTAAGTTTQISGATDGPNGIPTYLRKTWTATNTGYADIAYTHVNANRARASAGETYTVSSYFRASKGWTVTTNCRMAIEWFDSAGVRIGAITLGANIPTVVAGTWHKLSITATAPAGTVTFRAFQLVYIDAPAAWAVGNTIDGTGLVVTQNPTRWRFGDGSSPGWRWLGAANVSESVGYPLI